MATLKRLSTEVEHVLTAHYAVGRAPACQLRISRPEVSSLHAEFTWDGGRWLVHDLGSRNGTFVDGKRLDPGERAELQRGTTVAFGDADDRYGVTSCEPPSLMATAADGRHVVGDSTLMCLPSAEQPELTIFEDSDGRWILETGDDRRPVADGDAVVASGVPWTIHLPAAATRTRDAETLALALSAVDIEFYVSPDQEYVAIRLLHADGPIELEPRAHAQLLLALARARLEDIGRPELSESEHGWLYREHLAKDLAIESTLLNLWVYRARQQIASAKIRDAGNVIERRPGTSQIRIGTPRLILRGV